MEVRSTIPVDFLDCNNIGRVLSFNVYYYSAHGETKNVQAYKIV